MSVDLDLARRAVACRGWRWMPGMRVFAESLGCDDNTIIPDGYTGNAAELAQLRPDFRDPATRGCALQLVRGAWGDIGLHVQCLYRDGTWRWRVRGGKPHGAAFDRATERWHESEELALVAALEAAPERKR